MNRSLFTWWVNTGKQKKKKIIVNFGPQHPAAHGVLRLVLQLEGEIIQRTDIHIGLLHRGTEALITTKHIEKSIPYFDRLDYVSMMTQEHTLCLAIENLIAFTDYNLATNYIRILFDEITRILNHMLAIACHALDIGSMSSVFWAFEEREKLMEFYERVSGARMHAAYHRPQLRGALVVDKPLLLDIAYFTLNCFKTLNEMHNVLTYNKIWKQRLINIGALSLFDCQNFGLTGVMARSCGLRRDLRLSYTDSYSSYSSISMRSFIGLNGDTYDRFLIRMLEMGESLNIITFIVNKLFKFEATHLTSFNLPTIDSSGVSYTSMEDLISHFIAWHSGIFLPQATTVAAVEAPKGEFGVTLSGLDSCLPGKCKIRAPSYFNLQVLGKLTKGHLLADLSALIGTIDIVFGEIDR